MLKRIAYLALLVPTLVVSQPLDNVVAVVNDGVITASELNGQVETLRQQMIAKKMKLPSELVLRKQVLQHLIDVDLEIQLAKQHGMTVDNTELNDAITRIATSNNLSLSQLREEIERQHMSWQHYRGNIRREILISRLQQKSVGKDIVVSTQQIEDYLKASIYQDTKQWMYHVQNIVIPLPEDRTPEQFKKALKKSQELLKAIRGPDIKDDNFNHLAIQESDSQFTLESNDLGARHLTELPDIFAREVVKMKVGQTIGPLRTGNGLQLIKLVAIEGKNEKHEVIKTHVRHILLKPDATMTPAEAKQQAYNLYQQLKSGKDFSLMAKQYSADISSGLKGGDLGWISPGEVVPEFEKKMNDLSLNHVSEPIKSSFGWHLIEVLERKKVDDSKMFKRQQVKLLLQQKKFEEAIENWQQHLRTDAYVKIMDSKLS